MRENIFHCRYSYDCVQPQAPIWTPNASTTSIQTSIIKFHREIVPSIPHPPLHICLPARLLYVFWSGPGSYKRAFTYDLHSFSIHSNVPNLPSSLRTSSNDPSSRKLSLVHPHLKLHLILLITPFH